MMKKFFVLSMISLLATSALAASPKALTSTRSDLLAIIASDSIGRAALLQLKGCKIEVTKHAAQYEIFEVNGFCTQPANGPVGGGVYLMIKFEGQFWGRGVGELMKVEMGHAG